MNLLAQLQAAHAAPPSPAPQRRLGRPVADSLINQIYAAMADVGPGCQALRRADHQRPLGDVAPEGRRTHRPGRQARDGPRIADPHQALPENEMTPETLNDVHQLIADRSRAFHEKHGKPGRCALAMASSFAALDLLEHLAKPTLGPAAAVVTGQVVNSLALVACTNLPDSFPQILEQACELHQNLADTCKAAEGVEGAAAALMERFAATLRGET